MKPMTDSPLPTLGRFIRGAKSRIPINLKNFVIKQLLALGLIALAATTARAGELKKDYFSATKLGAWAEYKVEASDGSKWTSTDERQADDDARVVVEESVKISAGAGAGTESKNIYVLPKGFNLTRDWLSYGKFTEKMTMKFGTTVMPVADATLGAIKRRRRII